MSKQSNDQQRIAADWKTMILISHDFFHKWRKAVIEAYGEEAEEKLTLRFWDLVGAGTAESYLKKGKINPNDVEQVVQAVARSSEIMGEKVHVENDGAFFYLVHEQCPWINSYKASGAPGKCEPGCSRWFEAAVAALSPDLQVETTSSLALGHDKCVRKFWKKA